jgi:hypothetical protein
MNNFEFYSPTRVIFGQGVVSRLGEVCGALGKRALLVYGRSSIKESGLYDQVKAQLSLAGVSVAEHGGVIANPVLSHAEEGIRIARKENSDFILAVGGGSVIDESKAIAAGACSETPLWDFYLKKAIIEKALPIVAVQTLPATSSETNQAGVLTNPLTREKFSIRSPHLVPRAAFLDPELTFTVPLSYTSYACFDIMSHLLEGYFTSTDPFAPVQEGFVQGMVRAVMESLERILEDPRDYNARASVMWAGALAWNGLANAGLEGASIPNHMLEHPLSAVYDVPHGAGLAVVMPAWLEMKKSEIQPRILKFGTEILRLPGLSGTSGEAEKVDAVIAAFKTWISSINCPLTLDEAGVKDPDIQELTLQALKLGRLWGVPGYDEKTIRGFYDSIR